MQLTRMDTERRGPVILMGDTSEPTGDDPKAYEDDRAIPCPACESPNTVQIAARGLQYQCRDCANEFNPSSESMDTDLR